MAVYYFTAEELANRISAAAIKNIYDDDNDGTADSPAVDRLRADATSKVASYLHGLYDLDVIAADPPNEVVRLALDVAVAYAAQRFPSYVRRDWKPLLEAAELDLGRLRSGKTLLDVATVGENHEQVRRENPVAPATEAPARSFRDTGVF
jgi:phage gp36-like protein